MKIVIDYGTKASVEIVSLPEAKQNSNIDFDDQDALFQIYLDAITAEIENFIGAPVIARTNVIVQSDTWDLQEMPIPLNSITKVEWLDNEDLATEVTDYSFFANGLTLNDEPGGFHRLKITGTAGFEEIPADIKNAALLMFSERETFRENRPVKLNTTAQNILRAYKIY